MWRRGPGFMWRSGNARLQGLGLAIMVGAVAVFPSTMAPARAHLPFPRLLPGRHECGDGLLGYPQEACDDANALVGDGCSETCTVESGWRCGNGSDAVAWGDDYFGQSTPVAGSFVAISSGTYHSVALRADGSVVGWGRNADGQAESQAGPFIAIDTGLHHSIGLRPNGSVVGWGSNMEGQVEPHPGPFIAIASGREFNIGLFADGSVIGWGDNGQGQTAFKPGPYVAIAAGGYHCLGLKADGSVDGWGENQWGEADSKPGPYVAISAGDHHSLGLRPDGRVEAWGDNRYGQGTGRSGPFIAMDAGGFHNLGMYADGSVAGWGFNYYGQTVKMAGPIGAFSAGGFHSAAVLRGSCSVHCGDGIVLAPEQCDDLNSTAGDGCSENCQIEQWWQCPAPARPCVCLGNLQGPACDRCPDGFWGFPFCMPCLCDNGDVCDGAEWCDPVSGCNPGEPPTCDDGRECGIDWCDPVIGCMSDIRDCLCSLDSDCDDGDICNGVEGCRYGIGRCRNGEPPVCGDGDVCNGIETCDPLAGCLPGVALDCSDGRECSVDMCDPVAGCLIDDSGCLCDQDLDCDDLSICTGRDWCDYQAGICRLDPAPSCDDGRECTIDSCDPVAGCVFDASGCGCDEDIQCDDLSACTGTESCINSTGQCVPGRALECDDNRSCSADWCDITAGCLVDPSGCPCVSDDQCDDGSVCTGREFCDPVRGRCVAGAALDCRDGRPCTRDSCDRHTGCVNDPSSCRCADDGDCKLPYEDCDPASGRCRNMVCASCSGDTDCGFPGNVCHRFDSGMACVLDCAPGDFICPVGYECRDEGFARLCMPVAGDCKCEPAAALTCHAGNLWWFDGCGQPDRVAVDCGERGCFDRECCLEGESASEGGCRLVVEHQGDAGEPDIPDPEDVQSDSGGVADMEIDVPAGGCDATSGNPANPLKAVIPVLVVAALSLLAIGRFRRFDRPSRG